MGLLKTLADVAELHATTGQLELAGAVLAESELLLKQVHMPDQVACIRRAGALYCAAKMPGWRRNAWSQRSTATSRPARSQAFVRTSSIRPNWRYWPASLRPRSVCLRTIMVMQRIGYVHHPVHRRLGYHRRHGARRTCRCRCRCCLGAGRRWTKRRCWRLRGRLWRGRCRPRGRAGPDRAPVTRCRCPPPLASAIKGTSG